MSADTATRAPNTRGRRVGQQAAADEAAGDVRQGPSEAKALAALLAPIRGRLILAIALQVISSVASLVPFVAVAELGRALLAAGPVDEGRMWRIVGWAAFGLLLRFVTLAAASGITHFADVQLQLQIRRRLAAHLGRVPLGWFTERSTGQVKKAVQDDVAAMHHLVGHALPDLAAAVVTPLAALAYLLWVDWRLALLTLVTVPLFIAVYAVMMSGNPEKMDRYNAALARINTAVVEFVQGIAVVKAFGQARRAHRRFLEATDDFADFFGAWAAGIIRAEAVASALVAPPVMLLVVLGWGTWFTAEGWAAPVDVLPFALLGLGLTAPVLTLGHGADELRLARQAAGRVLAILDTPSMPESAASQTPKSNQVEYRGVGFSYDGQSDVLTGIDLTLQPGTVTAVVGPSGSGKSTLAALLPRFHDVTNGVITLGGIDLRDIPSEALYRRVGFVFQQVQLIRGTVRDNITLARPDATDDELHAAARAAQIHDRIIALPDGYDTILGVGAHLSGGEAQRISIARALLADAPILVLDEATAFADPESEAAIQDALSTLVAGRTLLVIAHRLSTVVDADQIVVLDGGRIVEHGRHTDLVAARGQYASLWQAHERTGRWAPRTETPQTLEVTT
ncbi:ABC transporter ATP-binding protein [Salinispora cortesiana]|uniref:ABC transporter ATP-binding protein n=1 Tax=Salinispora cortesiana TaxID=1305843 RepID=UPI0003FB7B2B|nr:ABC transporter ATP-binding protein [Salinispora cortesiana]